MVGPIAFSMILGNFVDKQYIKRKSFIFYGSITFTTHDFAWKSKHDEKPIECQRTKLKKQTFHNWLIQMVPH